MKKFIVVLACIAIALPAFAGGRAESSMEEEGPVTITVWYHGSRAGGMADAISSKILEYGEVTEGVDVELVELPEGSYTDQVNAAALAGDLPDLLDFDGPNLQAFAYAGYMRPIDDLVSDELLADFLPSIIAQGSYDGRLYSLGQYDAGLGIWGNREYLERAGVRIPTGVADAWTLDEFDEALAALQALPEVEFAIDLKMQYTGEWFSFAFGPIIQSFGGDVIDRETFDTADGVLNGPEAVAAVEWIQSLFDNGYADPAPATDDAFYGSRTAALAYVGHWMYNTHREALGDDLVLIPMPTFGPNHVSGMGSWNWGITNASAHPQQTWALLEYILDSDTILDVTAINGAVPARVSALDRNPLYQPGGALYIYRDQLNGIAVPRPGTPVYPTISKMMEEVIRNVASGADVQDELDRAVETIDRDLEDL